jgi:site-specific recombinase XerD
MTPQEAITRVLAYWRLTRYSPGTVQLYGEQLQRFAVWLAAQAIDDLRKVTYAHVAAYQMQLRQSALSRETQAVRLRAVKRLYQHLTDEGCLLLDPTEGLQEISRRQPLPRPVLSLREMKRLLAAPDTTTPQGIRDRALLEVLYATGIRIGELMKARKEDVQAATQTLHIRHAKGGTPRVVPLGAEATQWLVAYLERVRPPMVTARPFESALFIARGGTQPVAAIPEGGRDQENHHAASAAAQLRHAFDASRCAAARDSGTAGPSPPDQHGLLYPRHAVGRQSHARALSPRER